MNKSKEKQEKPWKKSPWEGNHQGPLEQKKRCWSPRIQWAKENHDSLEPCFSLVARFQAWANLMVTFSGRDVPIPAFASSSTFKPWAGTLTTLWKSQTHNCLWTHGVALRVPHLWVEIHALGHASKVTHCQQNIVNNVNVHSQEGDAVNYDDSTQCWPLEWEVWKDKKRTQDIRENL